MSSVTPNVDMGGYKRNAIHLVSHVAIRKARCGKTIRANYGIFRPTDSSRRNDNYSTYVIFVRMSPNKFCAAIPRIAREITASSVRY